MGFFDKILGQKQSNSYNNSVEQLQSLDFNFYQNCKLASQNLNSTNENSQEEQHKSSFHNNKKISYQEKSQQSEILQQNLSQTNNFKLNIQQNGKIQNDRKNQNNSQFSGIMSNNEGFMMPVESSESQYKCRIVLKNQNSQDLSQKRMEQKLNHLETDETLYFTILKVLIEELYRHLQQNQNVEYFYQQQILEIQTQQHDSQQQKKQFVNLEDFNEYSIKNSQQQEIVIWVNKDLENIMCTVDDKFKLNKFQEQLQKMQINDIKFNFLDMLLIFGLIDQQFYSLQQKQNNIQQEQENKNKLQILLEIQKQIYQKINYELKSYDTPINIRQKVDQYFNNNHWSFDKKFSSLNPQIKANFKEILSQLNENNLKIENKTIYPNNESSISIQTQKNKFNNESIRSNLTEDNKIETEITNNNKTKKKQVKLPEGLNYLQQQNIVLLQDLKGGGQGEIKLDEAQQCSCLI
ncbi:hypothetical protein PPERSA_11206 [Pseudocohnilembus persalinus]|uniref:Uncharacterized protein n=1 Tax=Pseudocohnilembus persalinus TaxID=266149 RepID=A0A0V0QZ94_PSEPJ|nr:hypothetical protein PPERSA_11206 [Pseudocohnilembus persalinus]|eukprot:KRX07657.1 hypothetical protein PPERSA_11206 [Pseudocohnilembus persalinus]